MFGVRRGGGGDVVYHIVVMEAFSLTRLQSSLLSLRRGRALRH